MALLFTSHRIGFTGSSSELSSTNYYMQRTPYAEEPKPRQKPKADANGIIRLRREEGPVDGLALRNQIAKARAKIAESQALLPKEAGSAYSDEKGVVKIIADRALEICQTSVGQTSLDSVLPVLIKTFTPENIVTIPEIPSALGTGLFLHPGFVRENAEIMTPGRLVTQLAHVFEASHGRRMLPVKRLEEPTMAMVKALRHLGYDAYLSQSSIIGVEGPQPSAAIFEKGSVVVTSLSPRVANGDHEAVTIIDDRGALAKLFLDAAFDAGHLLHAKRLQFMMDLAAGLGKIEGLDTSTKAFALGNIMGGVYADGSEMQASEALEDPIKTFNFSAGFAGSVRSMYMQAIGPETERLRLLIKKCLYRSLTLDSSSTFYADAIKALEISLARKDVDIVDKEAKLRSGGKKGDEISQELGKLPHVYIEKIFDVVEKLRDDLAKNGVAVKRMLRKDIPGMDPNEVEGRAREIIDTFFELKKSCGKNEERATEAANYISGFLDAHAHPSTGILPNDLYRRIIAYLEQKFVESNQKLESDK